jgi:hypothetical protein
VRFPALAAILLTSSAAHAQYFSDHATGEYQGYISWNADVRENNTTVRRQGKCTWDLVFQSDGKEIGTTTYHNEDITFPFGGRGGHLGDHMTKVVTDGRITRQPVPGGRLVGTKNANGQYNWDFVVPSYHAWKTVNEYTWANGGWQLQNTMNNTEDKQVQCAVLEITGGNSGSYGPAPPRVHITLSEAVQNVTLYQKWSFYPASPANPNQNRRSPGITQNPQGVSPHCRAILQQEQNITQQMAYAPTYDIKQMLKMQLDAIEPQAMECRRQMLGPGSTGNLGSNPPPPRRGACGVTVRC